ncbi:MULTISPECIES: acyltransferase family protein [Enterobacter cloacae complex]|uniref:acyltransferase family protein n=1 Tax=Enterobacter cloacae complex TaxID=354276 RepID=UPI00079AE559|nr:acyltransferase [Enterobacter hormaechei]MCW4735484.1 acyltransferase [Enterobacter hormaechei subsp. xiangfangensis]ELD7987322.1 acyltransferase [Enterobacter hormaechei]ELV3433843.1 acyltransferase [Enterobacter hormaechei]MDQ6590517.1 acyltransferase [Enterobacter hormaechei]CZX61690.1 acyltransferase 3 [Enterobacter hormaechei]
MSKEIRCLTGIRGVAALYVVAYHMLHHDVGITFIKNGYIAVDLFFVLSGFIMTYTYKDYFSNKVTGKSLYIFLNHRYSRVWPTYIFWTVATAIFIKQIDFNNYQLVLPNLFMIQSWGLSSSIVGTGWSVSVELLAYLFFPLMCIAVTKAGAKSSASLFILLVVVLLVVGYNRSGFVVGGQGGFSGPLDVVAYDGVGALMRGVSGFCLGVLSWNAYTFFKEKTHPYRANSIATIVAALIIISLSIKGTDIISVVLFSILIPVIGAHETSVGKFLSSKVAYFLGMVSYSMYLCHTLFIYDMKKYFNHIANATFNNKDTSLIAATIITLAIVTLISYISFILIENPTRKLLRTRNKFTTAQ